MQMVRALNKEQSNQSKIIEEKENCKLNVIMVDLEPQPSSTRFKLQLNKGSTSFKASIQVFYPSL